MKSSVSYKLLYAVKSSEKLLISYCFISLLKYSMNLKYGMMNKIFSPIALQLEAME